MTDTTLYLLGGLVVVTDGPGIYITLIVYNFRTARRGAEDD